MEQSSSHLIQEKSPRNTTSAPSVEQTPAFREEIRAILAESLAEIRAMPVLSLQACPTAVTSRSTPVKEHSTVHLVSKTDSDPEEPESFAVDEAAIDNLFGEEEGKHEGVNWIGCRISWRNTRITLQGQQ